jgi:pyruvate/2-oxoglutarate dehydrogenase complex dihydrolipoamide acyltransferase (E2) component
MKDKDSDRFEEFPFPISRTAGMDLVSAGKKINHIPVLLEVDISKARALIQSIKDKTGERISFTAWIICCLARAASEHKRIHAMRQGRKKLVLFDDVDVSTVIQRRMEDGPSSDTLPMPYIIRKANEKTLEQIHSEIRNAQTHPLAKGEQSIGQEIKLPPPWILRLSFALPGFIRSIYWTYLRSDPFFAKKTMGTVVVTSVGMFGKVGSGGVWGIPIGVHPLVVAIGGIARKPGVIKEAIEIREYLSLTILFDHDVTDGAAVATFVQCFRELLENACGLC